MEQRYYFGKLGEYGPYRKQINGWPHEGDVMRDFREKQGISPEMMAHRYGEALANLGEQERPAKTQFTSRWICKMEAENQIPMDFTRRRILINILGIPPALLGLTSLEEILPRSLAEILSGEAATPHSAPSALKDHSPINLDTYKTQIRIFWMLNETRQAYNFLDLVRATIEHLETLEKQSAGNLQRNVRELLYSYYRLVCRVYRDRMEFPSAYHYANLAVRVTKYLERNDLIATALYARGVVRLAWGEHGNKVVSNGMSELNHEKLKEALGDFDRAFPLAGPQLQGLILLSKSNVQGFLRASATDITIAARTMDRAGKFVWTEEKSPDFYSNILQHGAAHGLSEEQYLVESAMTLNAIGRSDLAIETFETLERLDAKKRRGKDQTRHYARIEVVEARAYLQTKEYALATYKATSAFLVLRDIYSLENIAPLQTITNSLLESPYRNQKEVKKLAQMLTSFYQPSREKKQ